MRIAPHLFVSCYLSILLASAQGTTNSSTEVLTPEVDAFINGILSEWNSAGGVGVAVVRKTNSGEWQIETKGYGTAKADGTNVTENTLFAIGSNSKLFAGLATGLLIANESLTPRLSWNTKVASVIPEWELMDPIASAGSSIIDVMSHRTGLPRHDLIYGLNDSLTDLMKRMRFLRNSTEFRETFQYCNLGYGVLSYLPTAVLPDHPPYARYVKAQIFDPLGLNSTTFSFEVANATGNLADGMARQSPNVTQNPLDGGIPRAIPYWAQLGGEDGNIMSGPGGIISNAADMAKWSQTLLLGGINPQTNASVIPEEAISMVSTGFSISSRSAALPVLSPQVYGAGQIQGTYRGHVVVEHDGGTPGFTSSIARLPFDNVGVVVLSNDELGGYFTQVIKFRLFDQALGLSPFDADSVYKTALAQTALGAGPAIPRSANATLPTGGFEAITGTYNNGGYGAVELCYASAGNASSTGSSEFCQNLLANATEVLPGAINPSVPTYLARWDKVFGQYLMLTHFNDNVFNISSLTSYPTGNASDPFWVYGLGAGAGPIATFVADGDSSGFGVTGGAWGAQVDDPAGNTVQERSEIWFDKV